MLLYGSTDVLDPMTLMPVPVYHIHHLSTNTPRFADLRLACRVRRSMNYRAGPELRPERGLTTSGTRIRDPHAATTAPRTPPLPILTHCRPLSAVSVRGLPPPPSVDQSVTLSYHPVTEDPVPC